ncbi:sacsin-like isoform X2 [Mytilus californianus]|nr:sacsin-like isoform X2 [Mytilus californianus]
MASSEDSDDSSEDGPEYNPIFQPPLIEQLKKILDEYPDDGQILKEIIQNAEDAEASQMKILFDERSVNSEDGTIEKKFKKYFKGPALCVYNNANFTKEDWDGIQMINSSVKEFDPVKIGRFGLGFKSVFHITDYPMIISGNRMLVLDPHKNANRVCINMKLNKLHKYKKHLDISYCLNALDGLFQFSQKTLDSGEFKGTLFRFPLRHEKTNLSDNVYDKEKILDLFNAFQAEASVELLFLKCLEKIELYIGDISGSNVSDRPHFTVKIAESCLDEVRERRSQLHQHMKLVGRDIAAKTFSTKFELTVETQTGSVDKLEQSWFVLHCLKGGNLSEELVKLSQDKALSYSPYISIAVPMTNDPEFKGHVFCLMPLPLENKSLTGYPVHVNGYFALSQNRRHVKWPSADQTLMTGHTDKSNRWNECLLKEVLVDVYDKVIQDLIQTCKDNGNTIERLNLIYKSIPDHRLITSHWDLIVDPLFDVLLRTPFLFSDSCGGKWIRPEEAVFKIFSSDVSSDVKTTIFRLMQKLSIDLVDVPEHIIDVLKRKNISIQILSQDFICQSMKSNSAYKSFTSEEKLDILSFLVSDGGFSGLHGLELLPLNNGCFCSFNHRNQNNQVFVCKEEVYLFPGQEEKFIRQGLNDEVYNKLFTAASKGNFQLAILHEQSDVANLIQATIAKYIGPITKKCIQWSQSNPVGMDWLKKVWSYIQQYDLNFFSHLNLIPHTKTNGLYKISTVFLLKSNGSFDIPSDVCCCLGYLDIVVLDFIPSEIENHISIRNFIYLPTVENVFQMLTKVQANGNVYQFIQKFNEAVTNSQRSQFVTYISRYSNMNRHLISLLSSLALFVEKTSRRFVSLNQVRSIADTDGLPLRYFRETLDCSDTKYRSLAQLLNATFIDREDVIIDILQNLSSQYSESDTNKMMAYVLKNISYYRKSEQLLSLAKGIPFVYSNDGQRKRVAELFDPEDPILPLIILDGNRFPKKQSLIVELKILRKLGLKTVNDVTPQDVLCCAQHIHSNSHKNTEKERSEKLFEFLQRFSGLLNNNISGYKLSHHLSNLRFVEPSQRRREFPLSLPWYTETSESTFCRPCDFLDAKHTKLVGSVRPVLNRDFSTNLALCFGWTVEPTVSNVVNQLLIITEKYKDQNKPELLPIINDIYRFLASHYDGSNIFQNLCTQKWIWIGNGFKAHNRVYLKTKPSDINLTPYLYPLPVELKDSILLQFFRKMNCIEEQDTILLIRVQSMIRDNYKSNTKTIERVKTDLQLVVNILNIVKDAPNDQVDGVLFPIHQQDKLKVVLKPPNECNYSKDDDDIFGDEKHFVHQDVPVDTAEKLGVQSVTDTLLEDAELLEEWGQSEPLTRRIKNLLEAYKDGLSVPKEIIQNADDAGATKVCFMYDQRDREKYGKMLLDKNMFECQGPALWAYNNATFSDEDLKSITKVSGATKETDTTKIGKFGLGFCSVYNLTEVPSFVTGDQMVIFDPHYDYLGDALKRKKQPGLKIDLRKNRKILERKRSQFEPYNGVFGCNLNVQQDNVCYNGTLFRLPLRTRQQASSSEISDKPYNNQQMISLMRIFAEAGGNLLLFTQNVATVEFYHLPENETDPQNASLLYSLQRQTLQLIERPMYMASAESRKSVLQELSTSIEDVRKDPNKHLSPVELSILLQISVKATGGLAHIGINGSSSSTKWFVTWATGTDRSKTLAMDSAVKGLLPLGSVACPLENIHGDTYRTCQLNELPFGFYKTSHVFCYLPLPVETKFPVHINGSFAVTSDRRRLSCKTTDDKDSFQSDWNEALMTDAVCNAYILFLKNLRHLNIETKEQFHKQWPVQYKKEENQSNFGKLQVSFYQKIANEKKGIEVFRREENFTSIDHCKFLDPKILETEFGDKAFSVCIQLLENDKTTMMQLPSRLSSCFKDAGCESIIESRIINIITFYSELVLPHLSSNEIWDEQIKDQLMLHALDNASDKILSLLQNHESIPTAPNRLFRRPSEIVNKTGPLNVLFCDEDQRFVVGTEYTTSKRLNTLKNLGMITDQLSEDLIEDRAVSIQSLATVCSQCALDRCAQFVKYLNTMHTSIIKNQRLLNKLQSIKFLPIKSKPNDWKWTWAADTVAHPGDKCEHYTCGNENHRKDTSVVFERPIEIYSATLNDIVGCIFPVLDESYFSRDSYHELFTQLGVNNAVDLGQALNNLSTLSNAVCQNGIGDGTHMLNNTTLSVYRYINDISIHNLHLEEKASFLYETAECYMDKKILLLDGSFVKPNNVFLDMSEDCIPYLYSLKRADHIRKLKGFVDLFRIEKQCPARRVINELLSYQSKHGSDAMNESEVRLYVRLLKVLVDSLNSDVIDNDTLRELYIPDADGVLSPIHTLCLDSIDIKSTDTMRFTHQSISPEIAVPLGINTKRQKKVADCSRPSKIYSKDFGQHEELITRINRILSGYPCDSGVLKEMVQNADDAKATEVHIVMDFAMHPTDNLLSETWKPLQGPAVLVCNDSYFSESDIEGIQRLGIGSKSGDPTKTGQYGVGFNAVYHLTDVPSFLTRGPEVQTGEVLCVMDPHCRYVPDATIQCPGREYINTEVLKEEHPNVFSCYHDQILLKETGTIFRLPIRTSQFKSDISGSHLTIEDVRELVNGFKDEMGEMLLFVNHVKSIKVSEIIEGKLQPVYCVHLEMSDTDAEMRQKFYNMIDSGSKSIRDCQEPDSIDPNEVKYFADIRDCNGAYSKWLIVRRMGFSGKHKIPEEVIGSYRNGNLGLLPRGGIALSLDEGKNEKENGKAFCFLPLPVETGLPVHVNGHFALDHEARRNLWTDDKEGYRLSWNKYLMEDVIVPSYVSALHIWKKKYSIDTGTPTNAQNMKKTLIEYHRLFPDTSKITGIFKFLAQSLYRWIYNYEEHMFPVCKLVTKTDVITTFYPVVSDVFHFPCVFNTLKTKNITITTDFKTVSHTSKRINERVSSLEHSGASLESRAVQRLSQFIQICKDIGIKLLECPKHILKSMKDADLKVEEMTPVLFISFLKSHEEEHEDSCKIGKMGQSLEETALRKIQNLEICIEYCKKVTNANFGDLMEGLPLNLTNDGALRSFSTSHPVFCSIYCSLLPHTSNLFLHCNLVDNFSPSDKGLKAFDIEGFVEHLPETLHLEKYRTKNIPVEWNPQSSNIPESDWIEKTWKFLSSVVRNTQQMTDNTESNTNAEVNTSESILKILNQLLYWSLVPSVQVKTCLVEQENETKTHLLMPVGEAMFILDISTFSGKLKRALEELRMPFLDENIYFEYDNIVKHLVVVRDRPISLLNLLFEKRHTIASLQIEPTDCIEIMDFLSDHLDIMLKNDSEKDILEKIKEIPLHVSITGQHCNIKSGQSVLVINDIVITDGIEEWAEASYTLLLQTSTKLTKLYETLGFTDKNLKNIDLYRKHLLPKFVALPREHHMAHIKYTRDVLLTKPIGGSFNEVQEDLISILERVQFVPDIDGDLKIASKFRDPTNELMRLMLSDSEFPATEYKDSEWIFFLKIIGLQTEITPEMVLQFANDIEQIGRNGITKENEKDLTSKSKLLVEHIFTRLEVDTNMLRSLNTIKFIPIHTICNWKSRICSQANEAELISFHNATLSYKQDICWTRCSLIPEWANPLNPLNQHYYVGMKKYDEMFKHLEIVEEPEFRDVVCHVQNICDNMNALIPTIQEDERLSSRIEKLMIGIYKWLHGKMNDGSNKDSMKRTLYAKPIIFLPVYKLFVSCNKVAIHIKEEDVIKPYLVEAPSKYASFYNLFECLGMQRHINVCSFVHVLNQLKTNIGDRTELFAEEMQIVKQAVQKMFDYLRLPLFGDTEYKQLSELKTLTMLSRELNLCDSKLLVYSDNEAFEEKIGGDMTMSYLVRLDELGVGITGSFSREFQKLPKHLQPNILSNMIKKRLKDSFELVPIDEKGQLIATLLSSSQFHKAVFRIAMHARKRIEWLTALDLNENIVNKWIENLEKIQVLQVRTIEFDLKFRDQKVGSKEVTCYYQKKDDSPSILYCALKATELKEWVVENSGVFDYAISHCCDRKFFDVGGLLVKTLLKIDKLEDMSILLDNENVEEFSISIRCQSSLFPPTGTTVHQNWHRFLDNSFTEFHEGEYVAVLLSEEQNEGDMYIPAVYIYAKILQKCDPIQNTLSIIRSTLLKYKVLVGRGRIQEIHAFDIFKFNRNKQETTQELVPFLDIADTSPDDRPLESICQDVEAIILAAWTLPEEERRKLIKRLYKKWHPDKNHGNEFASTEVFKFIKQAVLNLERGHGIRDNNTEDFDFSRNSAFWSHFQTWDHDATNNSERHSSETNGGGGAQGHTAGRQMREPVPSLAEANQWMQQAKRDVTAASNFFEAAEVGHNFNWICFICYQSVEKILKAMHYNMDSNNVPNSSSLENLVTGMNIELQDMVITLTTLLGNHAGLLYPDRHSIPSIPADEFDKAKADQAIKLAHKIIEYVSDRL